MAFSVSWTKAWSNSDNGAILYGSDLGNIQSDIQTALANGAALNSTNIWSALQTFNAGIKPAYITLPIQTAAPTTASDTGALYTKTANSVDELFYRMESSGTEVQMTRNGAVAGKIVQVVNASIATVVTCSTAMVVDNTIPQNTEGNEVVTVSITPTSSTNTLLIKGFASFGSNSSGPSVWSICQDSTADAIAAGFGSYVITNEQGFLIPFHKMAAGTTSSTTFKLRAGGPSGVTLYVNGTAGTSTRSFGGVQNAWIEVWEVTV